MRNHLLKLGLISILSLNYLYANNINNINYVLLLQPPKQNKTNTAILLKQYIYDLKQFNEILKTLYNNNDFKSTSETAELDIKNDKSYYTYDYIKNLIKVLNGLDPYNDYHILTNKGYIKYIEDTYNDNYKMYLNNNYEYENIINKNFKYIKSDIEKSLKSLSTNLQKEKNIKTYLKNIFRDLINATEEIKTETYKLKKLNVIESFNKYIDYKYKIPNNLAQYHSTLTDILNFMLNGNHKKSYLGIKDYYNKFYYNDIQGFIISQ